jgi:hypothetical protein
MQTFTTQKRSISPSVIVVPFQSDKQIVTLSFPNGCRINALKINNFTHVCERETQIKIEGPITVYLVATNFKGIYNLVVWSEEQEQYRCSCYEFRRDNWCSHCDAVPQREVAA